MNSIDTITVTVGSTEFITTTQTLNHAPTNSPLRVNPTVGAGKKSLFIDRDASHFRYILNFLRDGEVSLSADATFLQELHREAEFYKLPALCELIAARISDVKASDLVPVAKRRTRSTEAKAVSADMEDLGCAATVIAPTRCLFKPSKCAAGGRCVCRDILAGLSPVALSHAPSGQNTPTTTTTTAVPLAATHTEHAETAQTDADDADEEPVLVPSTIRFKARKPTTTITADDREANANANTHVVGAAATPERPHVTHNHSQSSPPPPPCALSTPTSTTTSPPPAASFSSPRVFGLSRDAALQESEAKLLSPTAVVSPCSPSPSSVSDSASAPSATATTTTATPITTAAAPADPSRVEFAWEEIHRHNHRGSCWLVVKGSVYDVTSFLDQHPAGAKAILRHGGTDATEDFQFHSSKAHALWRKLKIGRVHGAPCHEGRCAIM